MNAFKTWALAGVAALTMAAGVTAAEEPAIGGYCPVAYAKMGKAVKGDARWSSERDGQTFLFSAPHAKELFEEVAGPVPRGLPRLLRHGARNGEEDPLRPRDLFGPGRGDLPLLERQGLAHRRSRSGAAGPEPGEILSSMLPLSARPRPARFRPW